MEYKLISENEVAWSSGVLDSEGSVYIRKQTGGKNPVHSLEAEICMTDYYTIEKIYHIFKCGSFRPVRKKKVNPNHRQAWRVSWSSRDAEKVLHLMKPFLVTKLKEVELALEFLKTKNLRVGRAGLPDEVVEKREEMYQEMKELKKIEYSIEDWERGYL